MYTAEMAREDYYKVDMIALYSNYFVNFAERKVKESAKNGKRHFDFRFPNNKYFKECIPFIYEQFKLRGFEVFVTLDNIIKINW